MGHAPPFRGTPGFVVYRHLMYAVFPADAVIEGRAGLSDAHLATTPRTAIRTPTTTPPIWMAEKGASEGVTELSEKIAQVMFEIEKAERDYDLARAAELKRMELLTDGIGLRR